jgi:uncharacterized membrane protein YgdD (TMEM256/DUF423 family)
VDPGRLFLALGGVWCAASFLKGAFGAHLLAARLDARGLELWELAARYGFYAGLGLAVIGLAAGRGSTGGLQLAGGLLAAGSVLFSGSLACMAMGGPRWLGAATPLGGSSMIAGFLVLAWTVWRH